MSATFTARLSRLFDTVYPPGRGRYTSVELIAALTARGMQISAPYLSQLRSGARTHPSAATMASIAAFFRVSPAYFTDEAYFRLIDQELSLLAAMREEGVRYIAAKVVGLSAGAMDHIAARVEELRREEHLDHDPERPDPVREMSRVGQFACI